MIADSVKDVQMEPILSVRDLCVSFDTPGGTLHAASGVNFELYPGRILGIVGESGAGKSVTLSTILGLADGAYIERGSVKFEGQELLGAADQVVRKLRGSRIGMIFQDPMTSLNPVRRIGKQLSEAILAHDKRAPKALVRERVIEILRHVGIQAPEARYDAYPHELSGGMRQRVMIAMAMINKPHLLIADEPTTALDVTIQAQVLRLIVDMRNEVGAAVLIITHDLGVVAEIADDVAVMYAGRVVEHGPVASVFDNPKHPYTRALMASLPAIEEEVEALPVIPGMPPRLTEIPNGCAFHPRCPLYFGADECVSVQPELRRVEANHHAACHFSDLMDGHRVREGQGGGR